MIRSTVGLSVVVVCLSGTVASAQSPAIGQLPLPGDLYGYSPLVPTIDPFPSRSTGYAPSMFGPNGGKRLYYPAVTRLGTPTPVGQGAIAPGTVIGSTEPTVIVGSVPSTVPARGFRRFGR